MIRFDHDRELLRSYITSSVLDTVDYVLIFQSMLELEYDSVVSYINIKCNRGSCELSNRKDINGALLHFDNFIVNSFLLLPGEPFLIIGINDFGFIVIDMITNVVIEEVPFTKYYPALIDFSILKLVKITNNGIRVVLENRGAFSFIWTKLSKF